MSSSVLEDYTKLGAGQLVCAHCHMAHARSHKIYFLVAQSVVIGVGLHVFHSGSKLNNLL